MCTRATAHRAAVVQRRGKPGERADVFDICPRPDGARRALRAGVTAILDRIRAASPEVPVVVLALPPMERFHALPPRLAATLGRRAVRLDAVARDVVRAYPKVTVLDLDDATLTADDFAPDGFHPGAALHTMIAHRMAGLTTGPGCP